MELEEKALRAELVIGKSRSNPELIHFSLKTYIVDKFIGLDNL